MRITNTTVIMFVLSFGFDSACSLFFFLFYYYSQYSQTCFKKPRRQQRTCLL